MNDKVTIVSTVKGRVGISVPELRLKRDWPRQGARVTVDRDILKEAMYDPGVEYMFKTGMLYIEDMQDKIDLELEPEGAKEPVNIIVLDEAQMNRYMTVVPVNEFKGLVSKLSREQRQNLLDYAIEHQCTDMQKSDILKELTGVDVLQAVILNRKSKED